MKKTALTISALVLALSVSAQSMNDGLMFSSNNYTGSARSMAMGNAVTALGGDLGGVGINPAGSAVAAYSQVTISPGLNISLSKTHGTPVSNGDYPYFQREMRNTYTGFTLPNIGFSLNWDTYAKRGLKNFSFGVIMNQTRDFSERAYANGTNGTTSFMGSLAENAWLDGFDANRLNENNSWDNAPWDYVAAWQGGLIGGFDIVEKGLIGSTEKYKPESTKLKYLAGDVDQYFGREVYGSKDEYTFNFGMNFNDKVYVGLNLNLNSLDYSRLEYFKEQTVDEKNFDIEFEEKKGDDLIKTTAYLREGKMVTNLRAYGIGFSTKIGVIYTPVQGLRLGAAIQTPTWNRIREEFTTDASTQFSDRSFKAESPLGKNTYRFREPMRANFGLAYVFGSRALVSVDYELAAYNQMKFTSTDAFSDEFDLTNQEIRDFTGVGHNLRIGTEIKIIPQLAVRAGYSFLTSGEYEYLENGKKSPLKIYTHDVGFGLGYSSDNSFFMDLACKGTFHPAEYIMPYREYVYEKDTNTGEYLRDAEGYLIPDNNFLVPEIQNLRNNWKVVLTLGFRF